MKFLNTKNFENQAPINKRNKNLPGLTETGGSVYKWSPLTTLSPTRGESSITAHALADSNPVLPEII